MLGHVESGAKGPPEALVLALGAALEVEPQFFFEPLVDEFKDTECHFRKRRTTTAATRTRMLAHGTLFAEFVTRLETAFIDLPKVAIPEIRVESDEDIERAAAHCRMKWGLDLDRPIGSVTRAIEGVGGVVTRFDANAAKVDAFSRHGPRPIVVLNTDKKSATRSRHDAAHELGHLVMHRGIVTGVDEDDETERQADLFGSCFLFPRPSVFREFPRGRRINWDTVFALKKRWKVSAKSIVYRGHLFGLIAHDEYVRSMKEFSKYGWNSGEPEEPRAEEPEAIKMALDAIRQECNVSLANICDELHWTEALTHRVIGLRQDPPREPQAPERIHNGNVVQLGLWASKRAANNQ